MSEVPSSIKEIVEALDLGFDVFIAVKEANEDGKVNFKDWPKFIAILPSIPRAVGGIDKVDDEFINMSDEDVNFIIDRYTDHVFGDNTDPDKRNKIEAVIRDVIRLGRSVAALFDNESDT